LTYCFCNILANTFPGKENADLKQAITETKNMIPVPNAFLDDDDSDAFISSVIGSSAPMNEDDIIPVVLVRLGVNARADTDWVT